MIYPSHSLLVTHLRLEGHADVLQNELILLSLDSCLEKGEVEARGGIVAGSILMEKMTLHGKTSSRVFLQRVTYLLYPSLHVYSDDGQPGGNDTSAQGCRTPAAG